ncbi:hypothetical protein BGX30_005433, partial [Mortierella sp. GBA39]
MSAVLVLPTADQLEIPLSRVFLHWKRESSYWTSIITLKPGKRTFHSVFLPGTLGLRWESSFRKVPVKTCSSEKTKALPKGAHYIVGQKDIVLGQVLFHWLHDQRKKSVPVSGRLMKNASHFACTVLADLRNGSEDTESKAPLSFSAWWLDDLKKRYHISHCRLYGEAGGVDLEAIEPELIDIRQLCTHTPLAIFSTAMRLE